MCVRRLAKSNLQFVTMGHTQTHKHAIHTHTSRYYIIGYARMWLCVCVCVIACVPQCPTGARSPLQAFAWMCVTCGIRWTVEMAPFLPQGFIQTAIASSSSNRNSESSPVNGTDTEYFVAQFSHFVVGLKLSYVVRRNENSIWICLFA